MGYRATTGGGSLALQFLPQLHGVWRAFLDPWRQGMGQGVTHRGIQFTGLLLRQASKHLFGGEYELFGTGKLQ
jgi:hypothetical protein